MIDIKHYRNKLKEVCDNTFTKLIFLKHLKRNEVKDYQFVGYLNYVLSYSKQKDSFANMIKAKTIKSLKRYRAEIDEGLNEVMRIGLIDFDEYVFFRLIAYVIYKLIKYYRIIYIVL